jgi:hypothetical protein
LSTLTVSQKCPTCKGDCILYEYPIDSYECPDCDGLGRIKIIMPVGYLAGRAV